jgi:tight adherence protein B
MTAALIALAAGVAFAALTGCLVGAVRVDPGWQKGASPLARFLDARRRARFNDQLPEALATMSNALRAGFSLSQAFDSVAEQDEEPISGEFRVLQQQLRIGMGLEDALASMSARVGSDDLTLVTTAILVARKTGGNVTEIFDRISETIRGRVRIERKVRAMTAQGRLQGLVVSLMPLFLGVAMTIVKPGLMIPFFLSPAGALCVLASVVLIAAGWFFIRKIIRIDV